MEQERFNLQYVLEGLRREDSTCNKLETYEIFFERLDGVEDVRQTQFYKQNLSHYKFPSNVGFLGVYHRFWDEDLLMRLLLSSKQFSLSLELSPEWIARPDPERIELEVKIVTAMDDDKAVRLLSSMKPLDIANMYIALVSEQIVSTVKQKEEGYKQFYRMQQETKVQRFYRDLESLLERVQDNLEG